MEVTALQESFHSHFHSQCEVTKDKFHLPPIFRNVRSKNSKIQTKKLIPTPPSSPMGTQINVGPIVNLPASHWPGPGQSWLLIGCI